MAASFSVQIDKEMTAFIGETHVDNLAAYYKLVRARLLEPGWREDDFARVKDDAINAIKVGLRNNDEELAKEVLYADIYAGNTVRPLQLRDGEFPRKDHARRCEAVLPYALQPVEPVPRGCGRLLAGVPRRDEEGFQAPARGRRLPSAQQAAGPEHRSQSRRHRRQGHALGGVLDRFPDPRPRAPSPNIRRCCWPRPTSASTA